MLEINIPAFALGVAEELEKKSFLEKYAFDVSSMPLNENIIPTLKGQTKWKYVRTKDGLRLSDGNLVYSFGGFPDEYPSEDSRISRTTDDNILNFENDALQKGTAQIHRASPDNIYMTLADGLKNPTFMLQHEEGKNWRYSPSKKFLKKLKAIQETLPQNQPENIMIDPSALADGAAEQLKTAFEMDLINPYVPEGMLDATDIKNMVVNAKDSTRDFFAGHIKEHAHKPITSLLKSEVYGALLLDPLRKLLGMKKKPKPGFDSKGALIDLVPVVGSQAIHAL